MDDLDELQRLALISKVCTELDNHLGLSDRTLAEFIIHLAIEFPEPNSFRKALAENGAEFPGELSDNLLRIIKLMSDNVSTQRKAKIGASEVSTGLQTRVPRNETEVKFPGLTLANTKPVELDENFRERSIDELKSSPERQKVPVPSSLVEKERHSRSEKVAKNERRDEQSSYRRPGRKRSRRDESRSPEDLRRNSDMRYDSKPDRYYDEGHRREHRRNGSRERSRGDSRDRRNQRLDDRVDVKEMGKPQSRTPVVPELYGIHDGQACLADEMRSNPSGPVREPTSNLLMGQGMTTEQLRLMEAEEENNIQRSKKKLSDQEMWEARQLIASGVLPVSEYPTFDADSGMGVLGTFEETEEDLEIELNENEPAFLRGQTRLSRELSPVRIVANPDGSMQRAALQQVTMAKERREVRQAQANQLIDNMPKDLNRPWEDPMPDAGERLFTQELRGLNLTGTFELPEWKTKAEGKGLAFGQTSSKSLKDQRENLPIYRLKPQLCDALGKHRVLVVIGETGSGKTTQMTQYMVEMGFTGRGMIGCTQPRRVAAMSVAKRVAEEFGCELGKQVGYTIRFEDCTSPDTEIKYMTDGMLMREYLADNDLSKYVCVMLDEAHERTIHTDVLFGLLKDLLKRREDFRLVVTSATLDAEKFSAYFFECPIFTIPGRTYPVEVLYTKEPEPDYVEACITTVMQIHLSEPAGDILVFLTGQEEIDTCCEILYSRMKALGDLAPELIVLPVYGSLPSEMQSRIFDPPPAGTRKCVVATNIAEASLTIDGIYYVIDPGFCKQKAYNAKMGMDSLVVTPISQASARQRAGRAGRTGPGKCYRLYTEVAYKSEMLPSSIPELQRTNLGNVVLQLKAMGINDLLGFDFMDPPPIGTLVSAMESLYALGALDEEGLLTRVGRKMAEFPLEPQLSKMLIISVELGCGEEILTVVSMLSVENPFYRPKEKQAQADMKKAKFFQPEGDHLTLLAVYEAWKVSKFSNPWCYENFIQSRSMRRAQDVRKQLVSIMDRYKMDIVSAGRNYNKVRRTIVSGYFTNAAKKDPKEGYMTMVEGNPVYIHPSSALFNKSPEWVLYHELVLTTKEYMRNVMTIEPKWLVELAPQFYQAADANKMTRQKRMQKIEPLYDRFNPPNTWRLSKRRG